jgi:RNA polymerase sigma factor (sigma-70 family)
VAKTCCRGTTVIAAEPWEESDEALIRAAQAGEESALDELYVRTCDRLQAYVNRISGARLLRHVVSADVLQDTYVRVYRVLDALRPDANVEDFWLLLRRNAMWVVRNHGARNAGRQGESALGEGGLADHEREVERQTGTVTRRDEESWLQSQVGQMDSGQQEVVRRRLKQEPFGDIARDVGLSEEAVRQRYSRAIRSCERSSSPVVATDRSPRPPTGSSPGPEPRVRRGGPTAG